ncbi:MAG: hypothetical protein JXA33_26685 [Anaerolineae bacterium]|nr:hypothetical protein [Anaerolineae bacterium]
MEAGTIQRTIQLFKDALEGLNANISMIQLESLAIMVHKAMTVQGRTFHTPEHIFDLADASNPLLALAALFHDTVYPEVDEGFIPEIYETIVPYILETESYLALVPYVPEEDRLFRMTLAVFDFQPGQQLSPAHGQNEFLSALVMNKKLEGIVTETDLLKATACIEATIPFRGLNANHESPADVLEHRLQAINTQYQLAMPAKEIVQAVKWAVTFSNKDVENFSERESGNFLDNTWKLLPESNASLRLKGVYSIKSYRQALQKMEGFLTTLNPENIFNQYRGMPPEGEYQRMVALAYRNVHTAREYLGIKLLAAAILEALAEMTGGDAPVALFMGGIEGGIGCQRLDDFLPQVDASPLVSETSTVFGLLAFGRASASSFDMQHSPLSLFIYKQLGPDAIRNFLMTARDMFDGRVNAIDFLDALPAHLVAGLANACAELALTRSQALREYAARRVKS